MNRPTRSRLFFFCTLCAPLLFSLAVFAGPPDNFTATMMIEGMSLPIARMGNQMRSENPMMKGLVTITQLEAQKSLLISSATQTYMEQPMEKERIPTADDPRMVVKKKKIGTETVGGYSCIKYEATFQSKANPSEQYQAILWEAKKLGGLVIRTEMKSPKSVGALGKETLVTELNDIKIGAAKASMFEIPRDIKK